MPETLTKKRSITRLALLSLLSLFVIAPSSLSPCLATVADDQQYEQRLSSLANESNYLAALPGANVDSWVVADSPIKVYVQPGDNVAGYKPYYMDMLRNALIQWSEASHNQISFAFVDSPVTDGINVRWQADPTQSFTGRMLEGISKVRRPHGITGADVVLFTFPNIADVRATNVGLMFGCLHEIGHVLGIQGHSPCASDIMCATYHIQKSTYLTDVRLSARDKNTLMSIIKTGPHPNSHGAVVSLQNEACAHIRQKNFAAAIDCLEQCLRIEPDYRLAKTTLAVAYNNYALEFYTQGRYSEAADLYGKKIQYLDQVVQPNSPDLVKTLKTYAYCLHQSGSDAEAQKAKERLEKISCALAQ